MFSFLKNLFGPKVDLQEVVNRGGIVVDVRSAAEYKQQHGQNTKNIPLNDIASRADKIKKWDAPIITCCVSGVRSGAAASMLRKKGIEVYNGGAWHKVESTLHS